MVHARMRRSVARENPAAAPGLARRIGLTAATESTAMEVSGRRRALRWSSVAGRQPKRRHVSATDVAAAGTYRNELSRMDREGFIGEWSPLFGFPVA